MSDLVLVHLEISIYLSWDKYKNINTILYFIFWYIITYSHVVWKTVWSLISWLVKPADLNLHCFQKSIYLVSFYFQKSLYIKQHSKGSFFCSLGQVKFSLDKYIMVIFLSLDKYQICYFHIPA